MLHQIEGLIGHFKARPVEAVTHSNTLSINNFYLALPSDYVEIVSSSAVDFKTLSA